MLRASLFTSLAAVFFFLWSAQQPAEAKPAPELVAALEPQLATPWTGMAEALGHLRTVSETLLQHHDRRAIFATTYVFTSTEYARMAAEDRFEQPAAFEHLTTIFANLYRQALWNDLRGETDANPEAWRIAFAASEDASVSPTLLLLLSVNAHVTHDLPLALVASGEDLRSTQERTDYDAFNEAFRVAVGRDWDLLDSFGRTHGSLERAFEGQVALSLVYQKRAAAWRDAFRLETGPDQEAERQRLESEATALARNYLGWSWLI